MSRHERSGRRPLAMSAAHRAIPRDDTPMIDVDGVEYCQYCKTPLLVWEAAYDNAQYKTTTVVRRLAEMAGVPAFLVRYRVSLVTVQQVSPVWSDPYEADVEAWQRWIVRKHDEHHARCPRRA